jgi:hypothetical protein
MVESELLDAQLKLCLDRLSNGEPVDIKDEWIEDAGEMFKDCLRKQLAPREKEDFRIRMSNIGKPTCQLQKEKENAPKSRNEYNNYIVKGQDDVQIDGAVYDTKSCSPFAFNNKWRAGMSGLKKEDPFGYLKQMVGYSDAQGKPAGGWIVVNKSTGEVAVVGADFTNEDLDKQRKQMADVIDLILSDKPFKKCFKEEIETTRGQKPTGSKKVPITCTFCPYMKECWPTAQYLPATTSKAVNPKRYWYTEYATQSGE